ncbi:peptide MFS transporter [Salinibacter sp. 10B]|uniref:peptide MFS transporter n=1 Tax=Salinibacter sp. 10B TaxID=1923971 RepID=UPI002157AE9C|nr:peptide MFS transporter [Salinibacter sp. 10B]
MATSDSSDDSLQNGGGSASANTATVPQQQDFFGHPRGLATLFFTELWERFSYYGLRALLVLFMTAPAGASVANPGLGFGTAKATAIYGLYTAFVYLLALPGGWVADNIWGQRRSVFVGGCIIAAGHFSLAMPAVGLPDTSFFYLGLVLIVIGTGLLKPNISTMVGDLYPEGGARRDAGFSVFYMGINFGAILGPTLCGFLGEGYSWHWGFSLAGFGMLVGLLSYKLGVGNLGEAGTLDVEDEETVQRKSRNFYFSAAAVAAALVAFGFLATSGIINVTLTQVAEAAGVGIVIVTVLFFAQLTLGWRSVVSIGAFFVAATFVTGQFVDGMAFASQLAVGATVLLFIIVNIVRLAAPQFDVTLEKKRLFVIFWLFLLSALFWSGFEQAGSSMNLFAKDLTARGFGPYGWMQQTTPLLPVLILLIPVGYICYRVFSRDDLWWIAKGGVALLSVLVLGFLGYVSIQMAGGWTMPASILQNINPTFIVLLAPVFGSLWTWLANRNANPSIPVKFGLGLLGLAAGFFVISWGAVQASPGSPVGPQWLVVTYFLHTCGELALSPVGLSSMTKLAPDDRVGQMMGIWFVSTALGNLFAGLIAGQLEALDPSGLFGTVALIAGGGGLIALLAAPPVKRLMGDIE